MEKEEGGGAEIQWESLTCNMVEESVGFLKQNR